MTLWKFMLREIASHRARTLLTLLSIAISVGAVVSVNTATGTARRAYRQTYEAVAGRVALEIVAPAGGGFPEQLVEAVAKVPGVKEVWPILHRGTIAYLPARHLKLYVRGIDLARAEALRDYEIVDGRRPQNIDELLVDATFAESMALNVNDSVRLLGRRGMKHFTVAGLLRPREVAAMIPTEPFIMSVPAVQRLCSARGYIDSAQIMLTEGADEAAVRAAVAKELPEGIEVRKPLVRTELADETIKSAEQGLGFSCGLASVAALFIIVNTFLMIVSERRKQLATLRAVGATRGQVVRLILSEGLLLGAIGTLLGVFVGIGGAYLLTRAMENFFATTLPAVEITTGPIVLAVVLGLGVSIIASYLPARWAGQISPLEGMAGVTRHDRRGVSKWVPITGLVVLVITEVLVWASVAGKLPPLVALHNGVVSLVACVLILPALVKPLSAMFGRGLAWMIGAEGRLAERQVVRRQARTAFTTGVLFVAVCTVIGLGNTILNSTQDIEHWLSRTFIGDFFIGEMRNALAGDATARMPDELGPELRQIPGVTNVDTVRLMNVTAAGHPAVMIVKGFTSQDYLPLDLERASSDDVRRRLQAGDVVIGSVLAQRAKLRPGDTLLLGTDEVTRQVRIAATASEYLMGGLVVYLERDNARRMFGVQGVDLFTVKANAQALPVVESHLHALCRDRNLWLQSYAELSSHVHGIMAGVIGSLWVLLALAFVVAAFGIANTLTMNVLEQTREIGMLRVLAMTRQQIRKMVFAQATIIGLMGIGTGIVAGIVMSFLMNLSLVPVLGHRIEFTFHPSLLLICFAGGMSIVLAAAWIPAERAARLVVVEALHYE